MDNKRYGNLFSGYSTEPQKQIYSQLVEKTNKEIKNSARYGGVFDDYFTSSRIACRINKIKKELNDSMDENTIESRKTANEIRNNFFDTIKDNLKDKVFALYEKGDGTVAAFVFDDLVECNTWISKNPDTLRTTSFGGLFKKYGNCFVNIDNYRVTADILIISFKDASAT